MNFKFIFNLVIYIVLKIKIRSYRSSLEHILLLKETNQGDAIGEGHQRISTPVMSYIVCCTPQTYCRKYTRW